MLAIFFEPIIQILIYIVILMVVTLIAIYVLGLFRANSLQREHDINKELDYFQELNDNGKLSDVEFRIIKERFSKMIVAEIKNYKKQKSGIAPYKADASSLLFSADNSAALQDTQVVGSSEYGNKNGQAEYIEMETKRMQEHGEDCGIDWKVNLSNDDNTENENDNTEKNM
ncbi:MAG: hypothetical protein LBC74_09040 [Planctomycetaceae bacterium]|jgi:hypothetical protein|nr:hypothetical protein [Planctomycetaceae bacterium]